jgi:PAS domain S-box-containing protein
MQFLPFNVIFQQKSDPIFWTLRYFLYGNAFSLAGILCCRSDLYEIFMSDPSAFRSWPMSLMEISHLHTSVAEVHPHAVHFYTSDDVLIREVGRVLASALNRGEPAVVIATRDHCEKLERVLDREVGNFKNAVAAGWCVMLDASETLSRFMINGMPHPERFNDVIHPVLSRASLASGNARRRVTAFGEMVALLCAQGNGDAAARLEELWNALGKAHPFSLYCAYPIQAFSRPEDRDLFLRVCSEHSVIVGEDTIMAEGEERNLELQHESVSPPPDSDLEWRRREERFRLFVEAVQDYAIFMLDPHGNVSTWNNGAERIKGYKASDIIGKNFSNFYPEEDVRSGKPAMELEVAAREGRFEDEGWRVRKDGSRFWANVIITAVRDEHNHLIGFGKVTRDSTDRMLAQQALDRANQELKNEIFERKLTEQKLAESEQSLRMLSLHLLRTQDEERKRIGRDLHDSLGQVLTVMKMNLEALAPLAGERRDQIVKCIKLADDCIREVRTISYLLYPPMLEELGLRSAVPWYLDGFAARSGIRTTFEVSSDFDRLPRETELALFRVLQEGLTNVHRHAESPVAHVRLSCEDGTAALHIRDEGKGMSRANLNGSGKGHLPPTGVGLRGMNERMRQLGGKLEIYSSAEGTIVEAIVPSRTSADSKAAD